MFCLILNQVILKLPCRFAKAPWLRNTDKEDKLTHMLNTEDMFVTVSQTVVNKLQVENLFLEIFIFKITRICEKVMLMYTIYARYYAMCKNKCYWIHTIHNTQNIKLNVKKNRSPNNLPFSSVKAVKKFFFKVFAVLFHFLKCIYCVLVYSWKHQGYNRIIHTVASFSLHWCLYFSAFHWRVHVCHTVCPLELLPVRALWRSWHQGQEGNCSFSKWSYTTSHLY